MTTARIYDPVTDETWVRKAGFTDRDEAWVWVLDNVGTSWPDLLPKARRFAVAYGDFHTALDLRLDGSSGQERVAVRVSDDS